MAPTLKQIFNEELGWPVWEDLTEARWGVHRTEVYHREPDDTYWRVNYQVSNQGDNHGLRDGDCAPPVQVYPKRVVATTYETRVQPSRHIAISGKCSDMCSILLPDGNEINGCVPSECGIGGGDYLRVLVDQDTGIIIGWNPKNLLDSDS